MIQRISSLDVNFRIIARNAGVAVLCVAGLAVNAWIRSYATPPVVAGIKDFMTFYMGAKLVGTPALYDERAGWKVQDATVGRHSTIIPYVRLPFVAVFMKPLALLSYDDALRVWYVLVGLSLATFVWIVPANRLIASLAICWSEPVAACFNLAQDTTFLLVWIALSLLLYRQKRPFWAGLALALCLAKFHLILFVPLAMLIQKKWRLSSGFVAGTAALLAISFAAQGLHWPADYLQEIMTGNSQPSQHVMFDIRAAFFGWSQALALHLLGSLIVAAIALFIFWKSDFETALCCSLLAGLMTSLHVFDQDYVLTIPLCTLLLSRAQDKPLTILIFCTPFIYFSIRATILISFLVLVSVAIESWKSSNASMVSSCSSEALAA